MISKIELKKVKMLLKKGYIPVTSGNVYYKN